jgi:Gti1/Pac2 family transcription factor
MASASAISPAYYGHISTTLDAVLLFESYLAGTLKPVLRRLCDSEQAELIKSGNIFIYESRASGIKRWTDGVLWNNSRSCGDFLVYHEREKSQLRLGGKWSSTQRPEKPLGIHKRNSKSVSNKAERTLTRIGSEIQEAELLVKKAMRVTIGGVPHHLVSYYTPHDVTHKLSIPSNDPRFHYTYPRVELTTQQNFRELGPGITPFPTQTADPSRDPMLSCAAHKTGFIPQHPVLPISALTCSYPNPFRSPTKGKSHAHNTQRLMPVPASFHSSRSRDPILFTGPSHNPGFIPQRPVLAPARSPGFHSHYDKPGSGYGLTRNSPPTNYAVGRHEPQLYSNSGTSRAGQYDTLQQGPRSDKSTQTPTDCPVAATPAGRV